VVLSDDLAVSIAVRVTFIGAILIDSIEVTSVDFHRVTGQPTGVIRNHWRCQACEQQTEQ
jgi:hypothetical protein